MTTPLEAGRSPRSYSRRPRHVLVEEDRELGRDIDHAPKGEELNPRNHPKRVKQGFCKGEGLVRILLRTSVLRSPRRESCNGFVKENRELGKDFDHAPRVQEVSPWSQPRKVRQGLSKRKPLRISFRIP